ncbi:MAG: HicB like antitoxin of bacterial toxin-antitoxin system [Candidatus Eremiobacteraeota bacterium]|nr:HicB like antitoxin of bacterial toxin-antitoxin system [Candidatus Eremiobacteraeota bacterium]
MIVAPADERTTMAAPLAYRVLLEADDDMLRAIIPAFPSIFTFGTDREHALAMAKEAIELEIEMARERGLPIPPPDADVPMLVERVEPAA